MKTFSLWLHYVKDLIKFCFKKYPPFTQYGCHLIEGYMGSGKTLLANKIISNIDRDKYFVLSNINEFNDVNTFDLSKLFDNNQLIAKLPTTDKDGRKLWGIVIDEVNLSFNKRLNRTTNYNNIFLGLVELLIAQRHLGIPRIYFLGQSFELQDVQLQTLFKYVHLIVKTSKFPPFWYYKEHNKIIPLPRKIAVLTKIRGENKEFINVEKRAIKFKEKDFNYNHLGLRAKYEFLPTIYNENKH